jgi:hypothetical protein
MAVSGPNARKALQLASPAQDLSTEALPYMGVLDISFGGTTCASCACPSPANWLTRCTAPADYTSRACGNTS